MNQRFKVNTDPFRNGYRASGVVLDIAALPSPYGIGDVGPSALAWIERLNESGQRWWHALQSDASSYDSEHRSYSSFAGNPLLISPDWLIEDGLLSPGDCQCVSFPEDTIDYDVVVPFKHWLLHKAWKRFNEGARKDLRHLYEQFRKRQGHWLEDYALFRALKAKYRVAHHLEWPVGLVRREHQVLADARRELTSKIDQVRFAQFLLYRQTQRLKEYAGSRGVRLIGDLPLSIHPSSCEVWVSPELFVRDDQHTAERPGDLVPIWFSSSDRLRPDNHRAALGRVSYRWCVDRLHALLTQVDVARVDVRGISAAHRHATDGAPVARAARPTRKEQDGAPREPVPEAPRQVALGTLTSSEWDHIFDTRILQFAFNEGFRKTGSAEDYTPSSVVYTSVHETSGKLFNQLSDQSNCVNQTVGCALDDSWELIRRAWSSKAGLTMISLADLLNVEHSNQSEDDHDDHRRWRCSESVLAASPLYLLHELTRLSNRSADMKETSNSPVYRRSRAKARIQAMP
jgi:4-alpha-glucanotransferase